MNIFEVDLTEQGAQIGDYTVPIPRDAAPSRASRAPTGPSSASARSRPRSSAAAEGFPFQVMVVEKVGSDAYAYGTVHLGTNAGVPDDKMHRPRRRPPSPVQGRDRPPADRESEEHVFNPETQQRVGAAAAMHANL
jgi:multiple sugar transport system ATP-binding protein